MEAREILNSHLQKSGVAPEVYAEQRGVSRSAIYKFLSGKDIRLSTWERLNPHSNPSPGQQAEG